VLLGADLGFVRALLRLSIDPSSLQKDMAQLMSASAASRRIARLRDARPMP
jgi:hypothetical protein